MQGTQVFVSMLMGGLIDLQARSHGTHMSVPAYFGAGGPFKAHYKAWLNHVGRDTNALVRMLGAKAADQLVRRAEAQ